jgi:hemolysin activation/secretion protein
MAMPAAVGDVLNLADLEQGVDQINRLRRNQAEMQILPGQMPGGSIVAFSNKPADRFRFNAGVDNYGSQSTGTTRTRVGMDADNLLGFQEALSLTYVGALDSNALVFSTAVPVGYNTFSYTGSLSQYQSLIGNTALLYGDTLGHLFGWNRILSRGQSGKTSLDVTLSRRLSGRNINNLDLDPQTITVLRVGANRQQRLIWNEQQANWTVDAGVSRGLKAFGANADAAGIQDTEAHSQFTKLDTNVTLTLPIGAAGKQAWIWRSQLSGQWTKQALFGSEQIFAGGMGTVRGFREGGISGDRGFYMRNDWTWARAPQPFDIRFEPYLFTDAGRTQLIAEGRYRQLAGAGAGIRIQRRLGKAELSGELLIGRALQQPDELGPKRTVLLATINWTY